MKNALKIPRSLKHTTYTPGSDALSRTMWDALPTVHKDTSILKAFVLDTILGPMVAIADEDALHLLEFLDRRNLEQEIEKLRLSTKSSITQGKTNPIISIERELSDYFAGKLTVFKTPIELHGSPFQKSAWQALMNVPYGQTLSYAKQAKTIGRPSAFRAVATANGTNQICIVIPCHRIINSNGQLGGYGAGIDRKKWLINHEKNRK